jgi:hypothetical protein
MLRLLLALVTAMLWTSASAAQDTLSLSQAIALTLANNPALRAADPPLCQ